MTLSKLSKEIQELLEEGIAIIYVWKIGKSWRYSEFWYEDLNEKTFSMEDQISIDSIMEADKAATSFNGYEEFGSYTLKYIEDRIKYGYLRSKQDIRENEIEKAFKKIEDKKEEVKEDQTFLESEIEFWNDEVEEDKKEISKYKIGQYLYNCGDMANDSGWYKIINITIDKFGTFYDVEEIGGNRKNTYNEAYISEVDRMNGSTRIVTMEAKIKATNESYVYNQINALLGKDHDERIDIVSKDYEERIKLIENEDEENKDESTEEVKKENAKYQIGQVLYKYEDMAVNEGWYKVVNVTIDKFGIFSNITINKLAICYDVEEIGGHRVNRFPEYAISDIDNMSTKIVTKEARIESTSRTYVKNQLTALILKAVNEEKEEINNNETYSSNNFKIIKLDSNIRFGKNGSLAYIDQYTIYNESLGYASWDGKTPYTPAIRKKALKRMIDDGIINSIPHWIKSSTFKYTYQSRGFSPSCQPMNGLIGYENQKEYKFEVLTYNRKLTCKEIAEFELIDLNRG
jgi:hypothetical protein